MIVFTCDADDVKSNGAPEHTGLADADAVAPVTAAATVMVDDAVEVQPLASVPVTT